MKKILVFLMCLYSVEAMAKVIVIDGDSLRIGNHEIRLEGIDAPEYDQYCFDEKNMRYECGQTAEDALRQLVTKGVSCERHSVDRYNRETSICYAGDININKQMVLEGWAVAYTRYSESFAEAEAIAKKNKRGIWRGKFMRPEIFRRLKQEKEKDAR